MEREEYEALPVVRLPRQEYDALPFVIPGLPMGLRGDELLPKDGEPFRTNCCWGDLVVSYKRLERIP